MNELSYIHVYCAITKVNEKFQLERVYIGIV